MIRSALPTYIPAVLSDIHLAGVAFGSCIYPYTMLVAGAVSVDQSKIVSWNCAGE